jgi:iron donor protein CyaY
MATYAYTMDYDTAVTAAFKKIVALFDSFDPDLADSTATKDMATLQHLKSGQKLIVNTQRAVHQIWVAAPGQGIHFSMAEQGVWMDDKGKGIELHAFLTEQASHIFKAS